jgi:hypothetical protein
LWLEAIISKNSFLCAALASIGTITNVSFALPLSVSIAFPSPHPLPSPGPIPPELGGLQALEFLYLSENQLSGDSCFPFPSDTW